MAEIVQGRGEKWFKVERRNVKHASGKKKKERPLFINISEGI